MEYVVKQRPGGRSFSALDLEKERLAGVHADLDKLEPKDREDFVRVLKTIKVMNERLPHIREHLAKYVSDHNVSDAMRKLQAEADAELTREAAVAALQKVAAPESKPTADGKRR